MYISDTLIILIGSKNIVTVTLIFPSMQNMVQHGDSNLVLL